VEVERLQAEYGLDVRFAPYLLDPTTPREGKARRPMTNPADPPSYMEERGESLGLHFTRGRTWTSNSLLAHEAAEFAADHGDGFAFHRALFKAYFEDLADIGKPETLLETARAAGLDESALRQALDAGTYTQQVQDGIQWAREIGVSGVPTFVFNERYGVVGAQEHNVFEDLLRRIGVAKK
jgi:predicted DsbA family dithiol-disulfide isomerase